MNFFKKIDHIGVAVFNLENALKTYQLIGLTSSKIEKVEAMKVTVAFLSIGNTRLELLEPLTPDSVIAKFLEKKGEGIHHICFEVKDIQKSLKFLKNKGIHLVYDEPQKGSQNSLISFIHPKSAQGVLIELRQSKIASFRGHYVASSFNSIK